MRKTIAVLLATAFVATLPSVASAKKMKRHKQQRQVVMQPVDTNESGPRFVGNALHQLIVPLEVTFGTRRYQ
jgi:hypothetical protein